MAGEDAGKGGHEAEAGVADGVEAKPELDEDNPNTLGKLMAGEDAGKGGHEAELELDKDDLNKGKEEAVEAEDDDEGDPKSVVLVVETEIEVADPNKFDVVELELEEDNPNSPEFGNGDEDAPIEADPNRVEEVAFVRAGAEGPKLMDGTEAKVPNGEDGDEDEVEEDNVEDDGNKSGEEDEKGEFEEDEGEENREKPGAAEDEKPDIFAPLCTLPSESLLREGFQT
ncbi:hypothetical protein U1Q18_022899 [Sarracenia purpurea var. burkii]